MYISVAHATKLLAYNLVNKCISVILSFSLQICYLDELSNAFIILPIYLEKSAIHLL